MEEKTVLDHVPEEIGSSAEISVDDRRKKILELFGQYSENTITEEMNNGEFDFYVRFPKGSEDRYYYCFKDEDCHIIYHRFLPEDYADFEF